MTGLAWWSQTANTNANQDPTINFAEGQAPSTINDSARALMASAAKWRDDVSGAITTGGTSTAYTVTSYQSFDNLARLANQVIAFTPHTTNGATVTLNVDSLGAKPLRSAPSIELPAGTLVQGTPYAAIYNNSDQAFYLHGFFGNPYGVPIGAVIDFAGFNAPNSSFVLAYGQAISRTTYATLFSMFSTQYGNGDGSTTFNIPDLRGRVIAGRDDMGGSAAGRLTTTVSSSVNLGGNGGLETNALVTANLPPYTPSGTVGITNGSNVTSTDGITIQGGSGPGSTIRSTAYANLSASLTMNAQGGSSTAFTNLQPTLILNKLLRII